MNNWRLNKPLQLGEEPLILSSHIKPRVLTGEWGSKNTLLRIGCSQLVSAPLAVRINFASQMEPYFLCSAPLLSRAHRAQRVPFETHSACISKYRAAKGDVDVSLQQASGLQVMCRGWSVQVMCGWWSDAAVTGLRLSSSYTMGPKISLLGVVCMVLSGLLKGLAIASIFLPPWPLLWNGSGVSRMFWRSKRLPCSLRGHFERG